MAHDDSIIFERNSGRVTLTVRTEPDYDPDTSWIGEFSGYREPAGKDQKLVHRGSGLVLDHRGIWRDERGRIQAAPEENRYSRDFEYTFHNNGHEKIKYALRDSKQLDDINNGNLWFVGIVATVTLDGVEVGHASICGIPQGYPGGSAYIDTEARSIAREALGEARVWRTRNLRKAA